MTDTINIFIQKYLNIFEFMNNRYCFCNTVYVFTIEPDIKVMEVRARSKKHHIDICQHRHKEGEIFAKHAATAPEVVVVAVNR